MPTCRECLIDLPASEFYATNKGRCKRCVCARVTARRTTNLEAVRAYDRERAKSPESIARRTETTRSWRNRHRDRARAQVQAIRVHKAAPAHCEDCRRQSRLERHHPDYSRPLLVRWLCKPCHVKADNLRRSLEAA